MKRICCSILLFLALSSQLGTYLVYVVQQEINKENIAQQMARQLPEANLVKIKNSQEIKWEEKGREFYLQGTFYDIVKTEKVNGVIWYYCINDHMQTKLYNQYAKTIHSETTHLPNQKETKQHLKFSLSYFLVDSYSIFTFKDKRSNTPEFVYQDKLSSTFGTLLVPPPQQI